MAFPVHILSSSTVVILMVVHFPLCILQVIFQRFEMNAMVVLEISLLLPVLNDGVIVVDVV